MNEVKTPKKPLLYYYIAALLVLLLFNFLAMPWLAEHQIKDVDYNTFVSMTEQGQVGRVEIQQQSNRILFTDKDESAVYKTAIVPDDGLVQRLLDAGVSTTGVTGPIAFDENGDVSKDSAVLKTAQGGKLVYADTVTVSDVQ